MDFSPRNDFGLPKKNDPREDHLGSSFDYKEVLYIIRRYHWVISTVAFIAFFGTLMGHFIYLPTYKATAQLEVKPADKKTLAQYLSIASHRVDGGMEEEPLKKYTNHLLNSDFLIDVSRAIKLSKHSDSVVLKHPKDTSMFHKKFWMEVVHFFWKEEKSTSKPVYAMTSESIAQFLKTVTNIRTSRNNIFVDVTTLDDFTSMTLANFIAVEFEKNINEKDSDGLTSLENLLKEKIEQTKTKLKKNELMLINFKKQNGIAQSGQTGTSLSREMYKIEARIEDINLKIETNRKLIDSYQEKLDKHNTSLLKADSDVASKTTTIKLLKNQLNHLGQQKALMLSQSYSPSHWLLQEVSEKIKKIKDQLNESLQTSLKNTSHNNDSGEFERMQNAISSLESQNKKLEIQIPLLKKKRENITSKLSVVPKAEQLNLMLQRNVNLDYKNFERLQQKLNEIEIQKASIDKKIHINHLSRLPQEVSRTPLTLKLIFSLFVSVFLGIIISLMIEMLDSTIKSKTDIENLGITFLGEIPIISAKKKTVVNKSPEQLVCLAPNSSINSILFDFIRSKVESVRHKSGRTHNTITVTSVNAGEGKSFVASNLAISLAKLGKKTVLIDCDLRCPSVHCYFDTQNELGLVDLFESEAFLKDVLQKNDSPRPDLITSGWGTHDPTVIFSGANFRILLKFLRSKYDYVIIDSPPVNAVPDASILSQISDSVIMVAKSRSTSKQDFLEAQQKLQQISSKRIHAVVNFVDENRKLASYYPYALSSFNHHPTREKNGVVQENFEDKFQDFDEFISKNDKKGQTVPFSKRVG